MTFRGAANNQSQMLLLRLLLLHAKLQRYIRVFFTREAPSTPLEMSTSENFVAFIVLTVEIFTIAYGSNIYLTIIGSIRSIFY